MSGRGPRQQSHGVWQLAWSVTHTGRSTTLTTKTTGQAAADISLRVWAEEAIHAARSIDPDALVTLGLFTFQAVGKDSSSAHGLQPDTSVKDVRVPARPSVLGDILPVLDVHVYQVPGPPSSPWNLATDLASSDWASTASKPAVILMRDGRVLCISTQSSCLPHCKRCSCSYGCATTGFMCITASSACCSGHWLDTWEQPRIWNMNSAPELFIQLSSAARPDPCS